MSNRDSVIEAVRRLPEEASFEDIIEQISILAALRQGEADANAGRVVPHDEVKRRIACWLAQW